MLYYVLVKFFWRFIMSKCPGEKKSTSTSNRSCSSLSQYYQQLPCWPCSQNYILKILCLWLADVHLGELCCLLTASVVIELGLQSSTILIIFPAGMSCYKHSSLSHISLGKNYHMNIFTLTKWVKPLCPQVQESISVVRRYHSFYIFATRNCEDWRKTCYKTTQYVTGINDICLSDQYHFVNFGPSWNDIMRYFNPLILAFCIFRKLWVKNDSKSSQYNRFAWILEYEQTEMEKQKYKPLSTTDISIPSVAYRLAC